MVRRVREDLGVNIYCTRTELGYVVRVLSCVGGDRPSVCVWSETARVKCHFLSSAGIQTIDSTQALFLPIGASVSLLVMFFFFDSVQVVFTICTAGD